MAFRANFVLPRFAQFNREHLHPSNRRDSLAFRAVFLFVVTIAFTILVKKDVLKHSVTNPLLPASALSSRDLLSKSAAAKKDPPVSSFEGNVQEADHSNAFQPLDILCHFALLIETLAFAQSDITSLRIIEIAGAAMIVAFTLIETGGNWVDCHVVWGLLRIATNLFRLFYAYSTMLHALATLKAEEHGVWKTHLDTFSALEFVALKRKWTMETVPDGAVLMRQGQSVPSLLLIVTGKALVRLEKTRGVKAGAQGDEEEETAWKVQRAQDQKTVQNTELGGREEKGAPSPGGFGGGRANEAEVPGDDHYDGEIVSAVEEGQFLGEMAFFTGYKNILLLLCFFYVFPSG